MSFAVSMLFALAVLVSFAVQAWLLTRQVRHVRLHRSQVPEPFAGVVTLEQHQRAADYTLAKARVAHISLVVGTVTLLGWTLLGGLDALNTFMRDLVQPAWGPLAYQLALLASFALVASLIEIPLDLWSTFKVEQKFGFNRTTLRLYALDWLKGSMLAVVLGLPLAAAFLWLMGTTGSNWWIWVWGTWAGFQLLMMVLYPLVLAPLFNRFEPLTDLDLKTRLEGLMQRCGLTARGLYTMDGSRRSAHANAYFTGIGRARRVVLFDTLLERLSPQETEAVVAHEIGHWRKGHVPKRLVAVMVGAALTLAALAALSGKAWFFTGLGVTPNLGAPNDALALLLMGLGLPAFALLLSPLSAAWSRQHEFEADAYAKAHTSALDLSSALVKLHQDNAATLTPDPLYVRFHYSHPPTGERLAALRISPA